MWTASRSTSSDRVGFSVRVKVHLHGYFSTFHPGPIEVVADTVAQAIERVTRQLPGFRPNAIHGRHRVRVVGCDDLKSLFNPIDRDEIHLIPQFTGGKQGGFLQILLGIVLIGIGLLVGGPLGGILLKVGALMFFGGLAQLLAPQPEDDKEDKKKTQYLGAPKNTVKIGTRIPILFGTHQVYGHYLSFDIDAVDKSEGQWGLVLDPAPPT